MVLLDLKEKGKMTTKETTRIQLDDGTYVNWTPHCDGYIVKDARLEAALFPIGGDTWKWTADLDDRHIGSGEANNETAAMVDATYAIMKAAA
jgi:hypothetical protein